VERNQKEHAFFHTEKGLFWEPYGFQPQFLNLMASGLKSVSFPQKNLFFYISLIPQ
jgi:hypothetical protein